MTNFERPNRLRRQSLGRIILVIALLWCCAGIASAADMEEDVVLMVRGREVLAFSGLRGQWARARLSGGERVLTSTRAERLAIVVTTHRVLGFSAFTSAWDAERLEAGESVLNLEARGAVGAVLTDERVLGFGAKAGSWFAKRLP